MSSKRKLVKEASQCTLSDYEFTRSESPTRSVKLRTLPSTEKPESKQINMSNPEHTPDNMQLSPPKKKVHPSYIFLHLSANFWVKIQNTHHYRNGGTF